MFLSNLFPLHLLLPKQPINMEELSPFRLQSVRLPKGGFTFGIPSPKEVESYAKMQIAREKLKEWEKKLEQKSAFLDPQNDLRTNLPHCEKVADEDSKPKKGLVRPSQLPVKDALCAEFRDHGANLQPPAQADLTGFLESMIRHGKQIGVFEYFDDKITNLPPDDSVKLKDGQQIDQPDRLLDPPEGEAIHSAKEPEWTCESTPSRAKSSFTQTSSPLASSSSTATPLQTPGSSVSATPTVFDPLCYFMAKTSLQTSDQKSSMRVTVPKAYKFSISTDPKCHYDSMALFTTGTARRDPSGLKRKRDDLGFKAEEVIKKGALHTADLNAPCTLNGDIHEVFEEKHWTDCPHQVYTILKPGLLLASKLVTTSQCLQHFQTVLKGNREYCYKTSFRMRKRCHRIRQDVPITSDSSEQLKNLIKSMAGTITFQFLNAQIINSPDDESRYFATAIKVPCNHSSCSVSAGLRTSKLQSTIISMHPDFYIQAQKFRRLKYPDPAQMLRFQFFFAVTLMHEFAHAFEIACSPAETRIGNEVYLYDCLMAESGRQWEANIFGGFVTAINARVDSLHGLCVIEWPEPGLKDPSRLGLTDIWTVPMTFIQDLFSESFWEGIQNNGLGDKSLLNVPKTGASSVGVASFTTAKFEEVLEDRELAGLELALREVEGQIEVPVLDPDDEEVRSSKRRKMFVPHAWIKSMGRRGGLE